MVGICSINEARHILDQLLVTIIHKSVSEIQLKSILKDLENQLEECRETNKGAENLIQCLLQEQEKETSRANATHAEGDKNSTDSSNSTLTSRESSPIDGAPTTEASLEPKDMLKSRVRNFALPHLLHGNKRIPKDGTSDGSDERNNVATFTHDIVNGNWRALRVLTQKRQHVRDPRKHILKQFRGRLRDFQLNQGFNKDNC